MVETPPPIPDASLRPLMVACSGKPIAGAVVLGSGLGALLESWTPVVSLAGEEIPGYPRSTVPGHAGRVAIVRWADCLGLVLQGRVHFYEGFDRGAVTFGVRLAAALGARWILLTNASGALDPHLSPGTILIVEDHLRILMGAGPSRGAAPEPRWRGSPYHEGRTEEAFRILGAAGMRVMRGVLAGGLGPAYETAAEVEMARRLGAQAACMSTVIEAEEGARLGLEVAALSLVTNFGTGLAVGPLTHDEVVAMAAEAGPRLGRGIARLVTGWATEPGQGP